MLKYSAISGVEMSLQIDNDFVGIHKALYHFGRVLNGFVLLRDKFRRSLMNYAQLKIH